VYEVIVELYHMKLWGCTGSLVADIQQKTTQKTFGQLYPFTTDFHEARSFRRPNNHHSSLSHHSEKMSVKLKPALSNDEDLH